VCAIRPKCVDVERVLSKDGTDESKLERLTMMVAFRERIRLREKQITQPVPTSRMYTNDLIDEINNYDRAAVVQQAKNFDLKSLR
jgi:hypothetical protein